ncbi:MAG: hypothetical protein ABIQ95_15230 [Bdellovibrionia bacterium]
MHWKSLFLISILLLAVIPDSMAGSVRYSLGGNYTLNTLSLTDLTGTTTTISSLTSFNGTAAIDWKFNTGDTYFYVRAYGVYQSTQFDTSLTPGVPEEAVTSLGLGSEMGVKAWVFKLRGFAQLQDIYLLSQNGNFTFSQTRVSEFGGKLDLTLINRLDLDVILRAKYANIPATESVLSGSELGAGVYLEFGNFIRWTFGGEIINRAYSTSAGSLVSRDFQIGLSVILFQTAPNRTAQINRPTGWTGTDKGF